MKKGGNSERVIVGWIASAVLAAMLIAAALHVWVREPRQQPILQNIEDLVKRWAPLPSGPPDQ